MSSRYSFKVLKWNGALNSWYTVEPGSAPADAAIKKDTIIKILSFNLSCSLPLPATRLHQFLRYLQANNVLPDVMLLQEFHYQCFGRLMTDTWVRSNYSISSGSPYDWGRLDNSGIPYGTVALWRSTLPVPRNHFRVSLKDTTCAQSTLYLDFKKEDGSYFRLATVQLDLPVVEAVRNAQLAEIDDYLKEHEIGDYKQTSGLLVGDINTTGTDVKL